MREDWKFDKTCLIDACLNEELIAEIGFPAIRAAVVVELRRAKPTPHIATHMHIIDGEPVYLRLIGEEWLEGRLRPALVVAYTLYRRMIQPLWVFKASEWTPDEAREVDAGTMGLVLKPRASPGKPRNNLPLPEKLERKLATELRSARRQRKH